jgi:hypothetical protein
MGLLKNTSSPTGSEYRRTKIWRDILFDSESYCILARTAGVNILAVSRVEKPRIFTVCITSLGF